MMGHIPAVCLLWKMTQHPVLEMLRQIGALAVGYPTVAASAGIGPMLPTN